MDNKKTKIDVNQIRLLIQERKDEIKEKFKAEIVEIFGSYARGEEKEGSDIDVLGLGREQAFLTLQGLSFILKTCLEFRWMLFWKEALTR